MDPQNDSEKASCSTTRKNSFLVSLWRRFGLFITDTSGVETGGIERIQEDNRQDTHLWNNLFLWLSANLAIPTVAIGLLAGDVFELSFKQAVITEFCFGLVAAVCPALVATLGPKTGLRTVVISRFSSGYLGGTIFSVLNVFAQVAWSFSTVILAGQILTFVDVGSIPLFAGIVIVAILSFVPCFVGYNLVHASEKYMWLPMLVLELFLWGLGAKAGYELDANDAGGVTTVSGILGLGGVVFGTTAAWSTIAADYNCRLPKDTSSIKIFSFAFFGFFLPCFFLEMLGSALGTIKHSTYVDPYTDGKAGLLFAQVLSPWHGFGQFLLVLIALSSVCPTILSTYSAGLAIQALGRPFAKVPRIAWTFLAWAVYTAAAIAGRDHFSAILSNLLAVMGYWTIIFVVTVLEEHFLFRRGIGYNLDGWDSPQRLPVGIAGIMACIFGACGAVLGMSEVWFTGPIGVKVGGSLGFELAAIFCGLSYPPMRWLELRHFVR